MNTNYKLPENTYIGFLSIGNNKRERNVDPVADIDTPNDISVNKEDPDQDKKDLTESYSDIKTAMDSNDRPEDKVLRAKYILHDMARASVHHRDILAGANLIDTDSSDADHHLKNLISGASALSPEIHEEVRQTLRKNKDDTRLNAKYSWVFDHPQTHIDTPDYSEEPHKQYLDPAHIKKYHENQFKFVSGRIIEDEITGSHHHLNHDGTISPVLKQFSYINPPFSDNTGETIKYNHELLSHHYGRQLDDLKQHPGYNPLTEYTEDSVSYNKASARANSGKKPTTEDKMYFGSGEQEGAHRINNLLLSLDPHPFAFSTYAGMSKSTDPSKAEETSPGRKTSHLPAFSSTSLHAGTAQGFSRPKPSDISKGLDIHDIIEMKVPKYHVGGAYIDHHSTNQGEHEFLLTHGHVVEHDAEPKYYASGRRLFRAWTNGEIKGISQHEDWKHLDRSPEEMTPEVTKKMEGSHIASVKYHALDSEHASPKLLTDAANTSGVTSLIRKAVQHKNMDQKSLSKVLENSHKSVHLMALKNPNYGEDSAFVSMHMHPDLSEDVLKHPNVPRHVALMASTHPNAAIRAGAALSGKLHPNEIEKMHNDESHIVRNAAMLASGKLDEQLDSLLNKAIVVLNS